MATEVSLLIEPENCIFVLGFSTDWTGRGIVIVFDGTCCSRLLIQLLRLLVVHRLRRFLQICILNLVIVLFYCQRIFRLPIHQF